MTKLTQEYLKSILTYNPETGHFTRIKDLRTSKAGDVVGSTNPNTYVRISVNNNHLYAHRLAFLYMTGEWPNQHIDHINQIPFDNRWCNLRQCNRSQNKTNTKKYKNNKSGFKGIYWESERKRWRAQITVKSKVIRLGRYVDKHEAARAYNKKALEVFGEFACLNDFIT